MIKKEVNNDSNLILKIEEKINELKEDIDDIRSQFETRINDIGNEVDYMVDDIGDIQEEVNKLKEDFQNRNNSDTLFNTKMNKAIDVILKVLKIDPNEWEYKCEVVKRGGNNEK